MTIPMLPASVLKPETLGTANSLPAIESLQRQYAPRPDRVERIGRVANFFLGRDPSVSDMQSGREVVHSVMDFEPVTAAWNNFDRLAGAGVAAAALGATYRFGVEVDQHGLDQATTNVMNYLTSLGGSDADPNIITDSNGGQFDLTNREYIDLGVDLD